MDNEVKLHVGYVGKTREGKRVEISRDDEADPYECCRGDDSIWRFRDGRSNIEDVFDIIGPWEEPDAEYETGKWYGWNGGECPVHPETVVDITYYDGAVRKDKEAGFMLWSEPLLFRIVTPYVAPPPKMECWVNVYKNGAVGRYRTKEDADQFSHSGRIRCVRMVEADEQEDKIK